MTSLNFYKNVLFFIQPFRYENYRCLIFSGPFLKKNDSGNRKILKMVLVLYLTPKNLRCCKYTNPQLLDSNYFGFIKHVKASFFTSCNKRKKVDIDKIQLPPEPQNCCMSGCAKCVWVEYAEELAKILENGEEIARKKILEQVKDPNLRTFLLLELSHLFKQGK